LGWLAPLPSHDRSHERARRRRHTSTAAFYHTGVHHCHSIFWPPPENPSWHAARSAARKESREDGECRSQNPMK
jgi:hypothetical protein